MPVYNQFIATSTRRKNKPFNEAASAGGAKVPRVGVNKSDLEAQAAEHGWAPRLLTYEDVQQMSSAELRWHEVWNKEHLDEAFKNEQARRHRKESVPRTRVRLAWQGNFTEEEDRLARESGNAFALHTPSFPRTLEAAMLMAEYMKLNDLDATQESSYSKAFRELVEQGKITPLKPESADSYLQNHPELRDTRKPPMIQAKEAKTKATEEHFAKAQAASAKSGNTTVTDYPREQHGVPPLNEIEKTSLRQKVRSMTADELAAKCSTDPSFKKALDSLQ